MRKPSTGVEIARYGEATVASARATASVSVALTEADRRFLLDLVSTGAATSADEIACRALADEASRLAVLARQSRDGAMDALPDALDSIVREERAGDAAAERSRKVGEAAHAKAELERRLEEATDQLELLMATPPDAAPEQGDAGPVTGEATTLRRTRRRAA